MHTILSTLQKKFHQAAVTAYPTLAHTDFPLEVVQSTHSKFGHYQFNSAMKLTKLLEQKPREIAEKIIAHLDLHDGEGNAIVSHVEVAGPGFINISLAPSFLSNYLDSMFRHAHLGIDFPAHPKRVIIDFSSPNTAKEMHVGHLRSTIIGDCLAHLFEYLGQDVLRLNHIGDWGTSFGMLIAHLKEKTPTILDGRESTDLTHLVQWYKEAKQRFDNEPSFKKAAQQEVVSLQSGEPDALKAWKIICDISRKAYQEIYDILDVKLQERGESFYNPMLPGIVQDLEEKGLITISDGAKCVFLEGFQNREGEFLPLMVQKSDGGYNYDTTDMAAIRQRIEDEKGDHLIYITDAGQAQHFRMIFQAAEKAGYLDPQKTRVDHVPFGLVLGLDGKKFRTRAGDTERLIDLLNAAINKSKEILTERSPEMDASEREYLAKILGINAIKYADLSCHRVGDYVFSYDRMLRFEGNTAAFLMYAYVRIAGIKRKIDIDFNQVLSSSRIHLEHPSEIALGMHVAQYREALEQMSEELLPNRLTDYLYSLAEKFNAFFRDCRVEGTQEQNSRLLLCEIVAKVMKEGLQILGLKTVEKM